MLQQEKQIKGEQFEAVAGAFKQLIGQSNLFDDLDPLEDGSASSASAAFTPALMDAPAAPLHNPFNPMHALAADMHPLQAMAAYQQQSTDLNQQQQLRLGFPSEYSYLHQQQLQQQQQRAAAKRAHDQQVEEAQAALAAARAQLEQHEASMLARKQREQQEQQAKAEPVEGTGQIPSDKTWANVLEVLTIMGAMNKDASKTYKQLKAVSHNLSGSGMRTYKELED